MKRKGILNLVFYIYFCLASLLKLITFKNTHTCCFFVYVYYVKDNYNSEILLVNVVVQYYGNMLFHIDIKIYLQVTYNNSNVWLPNKSLTGLKCCIERFKL